MDLEEEQVRLLRRDAEWASIASEGRDVEGMLAFWTDDAVALPPGLPAVVGKAPLREYVRKSPDPGFRIAWRSTDVQFSPDGSLGYIVQPERRDDIRAGWQAHDQCRSCGDDLAPRIRRRLALRG